MRPNKNKAFIGLERLTQEKHMKQWLIGGLMVYAGHLGCAAIFNDAPQPMLNLTRLSMAPFLLYPTALQTTKFIEYGPFGVSWSYQWRSMRCVG